VEEYKASAKTFSPGDLPQWKAPEVPKEFQPGGKKKAAPKPKIKVELKKVVRELGVPSEHVSKDTHLLDPETGELHVGAAKPGAMYPYPGQAWHITLPTGEVIEFNDKEATSTPKGQVGRIRFKADATQGSKSLENIRAFLESAGLPMPEATEPDMELLYWRQLAGILADRKDWNSGEHSKVWADVATGAAKIEVPLTQADALKLISTLRKSGISPEEEIAVWRKAWAHLTTPEQVLQWAEDGGYLPFLKHWDLANPDVPGGKPVWYHFDVMTPEKQAWLATRNPPGHNYYNSSRDGVLITRTGGLLSTEARLRALGTSISGMSSTSDMGSDKGSAGFLFTKPGTGGLSNQVRMHPRVLALTQAYGWGSDHFGDISQRKSLAPFSVASTSKVTGYELMLPDGVSLLDDIEQMEASGETQRQQIISELKAKGLTSIRGVPLEQRIVTSIGGSALDQVKAATKAQSHQMFARSEVDYEPPPSDVITSGAIETEAEQAGAVAANQPGALAHEVEGVTASAAHETGSNEAAVSAMFHTPGASASEVKYKMAADVAQEMAVASDDLAALNADANLTFEQSWGATDRDRIVAGLIKVWAQSNSSPIAVALQDAAAELFGLPKSLEKIPGAFTQDTATAQKLLAAHGDVLRDFIRAQWQLTQNALEKAEITNVTLYRVLRWNDAPEWAKGHKPGDVIDAPAQRPLASWGFKSSGAMGAGTFNYGSHELLVKATFPAQLLLSFPRTGFGSYAETEFVALEAPGAWEVVKS